MSAKSSTLNVRIQPEIKKEAERIFASLGLSSSSAINIFYRQVIEHNGLPFEVKNSSSKPLEAEKMTKEELFSELEKGYEDIVSGRSSSVEDAFADISKRLGL